jgi:hypothetical protein
MKRETRDVWAKRVERWVDRGLTATEFAAEIGVNPKTLASWRWRLGQEAAHPVGRESGAVAAPPFVELLAATSTEAPAEMEPLELVLADGRRLRIPVRFDP